MESEIPAQRLEEIIKKLGAVPMKTTNRAPVARQIINIVRSSRFLSLRSLASIAES